jgi:hypothetical protein
MGTSSSSKHQSTGPAGFIQMLPYYSATSYEIASGHFVSCQLQVGSEVGLASVRALVPVSAPALAPASVLAAAWVLAAA